MQAGFDSNETVLNFRLAQKQPISPRFCRTLEILVFDLQSMQSRVSYGHVVLKLCRLALLL